MSKKVKDIIFYCLAGVLALAVGIAAVLEAVKGEGNLAVSIIAAVAAIGLCVLSGIEVYSAVSDKEAALAAVESRPVEPNPFVEEVKPVVESAAKKPVANKTSTKKSTAKKSSK